MKKLIAVLLSLSFVFALLSAFPASAAALPFRDVPENEWFYEPVKAVYEAGIMKGTSAATFGPQSPMTRGQIVTILSRMSGDEVAGMASEMSFRDVNRAEYYADPIGWAVKNGIAKGMSETTFEPETPVLRQEFAAFFVRYMRYKGISFPEEAVAPFPEKFPDWAAEDIETLHRTGLVKGDEAGKFNPEARMTRAEIATVTDRFVSMTPADPMYGALETLTSMRCASHRSVHYIAGRSPVEAETADISLSRIGAGIRDALGLDPETYAVTVDPVVPALFEEMHYLFPQTYDSQIVQSKVSIKNVKTGESTEKKSVNVMINFDMTKDCDTVGVCPNTARDEKMDSVWNGLDGLYVFDDDGKIPVPYNLCGTGADLSVYFTRILLALDDDHGLGQDNGSYKLEVTAEDFENVLAARDAGGEVTVTATLYNNKLGIRSEEKTLTLRVMNRAQCVEKFEALKARLSAQMEELDRLIGDCEAAGIPTDYEYAALSVLGIYLEEHIDDYIAIPDFSRELYLRRSTDRIYEEAKANLEGYLSGAKEPKNVPKYVTSGIEVDGFTLRANTVDSYGNFENRPVYFFGYGDGGEYPWTYAKYYSDLGNNAFHYYGLAVSRVVRAATPSDTVGVSADGKYVVDTSDLERDLHYFSDLNDGDQAVSFMLVLGADSICDIYPELARIEGSEGGQVGINLNHPKGREVIEAYLRAVVPIVVKYKCINSFVIANEPAFKPSAHGDYYVPMWAEFLKDKYGSIERLNEVYGASYAKFEDVPLADREILIERDQLSLDNQEFATKVHSDWFRWVAGIVHEMAPDIPISTKLKSIEFDRAMQQYGLRPEDWADFQDLGGCDDVREDVMYYDHIAYAEEAPVVDSEVHIYHDSRDTAFTYGMDVLTERIIWRGMMHHLGIGNFYSDDYWPGYSDHFTFGNSAYRPLGRYKIGAVTMDLNRLSCEVDAIVSEEPDVAILYSYPSRQFTTGSSTETMNGAYLGALECGKKVRVLSEEQIEKLESDKIKLLIIPESVNVYEKTLEAIDAFVARGGKVIVFGFDSMTRNELNEETSSALPDKIKAAADVYGIWTSAEEYRTVLADWFKKNEMQRIWVVDAATGEPVGEATEWLSADYYGKTLVTLWSMGCDEPLEVRIVLDGVTVPSSKDLRTGNYYGETVKLEHDVTLLLELDADDPEPTTAPDVPAHAVEDGFEYAVSNGEATVVRYTGGGTDVTVPETLGGVPVTGIGGIAFTSSDPAVKSVVLPESVTALPEYAFCRCFSLETVSIPGVREIGDSAFYDCKSLRSIDIPDAVEKIGGRTFARCTSLRSVGFPAGLYEIGKYAFYGCSALESLEFPSGLRYIGSGAFWGASSVTGTLEIPYGVTEIMYNAFRECAKIERVVLPNSVLSIGERAFVDDRSLTEVVLPDSLTSIGNNAFTNCPLVSLDVPYGVVSIGSIHMNTPIYIPPTVNFLPDYWDFNAGVEVEAGSPYERICREFGISYTIVEREHHIHTPGAEPTCTSAQTCTECGAVLHATYGHVWVAERGDDGKAVWRCSVCGEKR
ncbi:MAG: leucine-rich repeat protein [Clostridia bacterium]|nr:leucine-rich repeat protein [Clostridia bacterium]